jgi:hypothetical protein
MFWFIIGFASGGLFGALGMALMAAASAADRQTEDSERFLHLYAEQINGAAND